MKIINNEIKVRDIYKGLMNNAIIEIIEVNKKNGFVKYRVNGNVHSYGLEAFKRLNQEEKNNNIDSDKMVYSKIDIFIKDNENYSNDDIAKLFDIQFEIGSKDLVIMNGIHCFSHCEHHCALMELNINIAYIPKDGKVLGLSKFPRICDMVSKRLQVQERIGMDICEVLQKLGRY